MRRKIYNDDQKYLGGIICLPTHISRTQSGLWENEVCPNTLITNLQEPYTYKDNSVKIQRFGTFGPSNDALDQSPLTGGNEFTELGFPQFFNTVQPNQIRRTRSIMAFSLGDLHTTTMGTSNFQSDNAFFNEINHNGSDQPLQLPSNILPNPLAQGSEDHTMLTMANTKLNSATNAVYDDVATSSTITVISRDTKRRSVQLDSYLPSLKEFDRFQ